MISKNDIFTVEIVDQDDRGQGIGKASGFPLFIRHAVTGDVVKVVVTKSKKSFGFARILEFVKKSPFRADPPCPAYKRCGGCQLQNMDYTAQLEFKRNRVRECLRRIGGFEDIEVEAVIGSQQVLRYRNKAQYPVGKDKTGRTICGFFAERTHEIVESSDCLLSPKEFQEITSIVIEWMEENGIEPYDENTHTGILRHIFLRRASASGETALTLVINAENPPRADRLIKKMEAYGGVAGISLCVNTRRDNVILTDRIINIYGKSYIEDEIGDVKYRISPASFYQVNPEQTEILYDKTVEFAKLSGNETVIDLYCGIGTISLFAARHAKKVYGIEIVPQAIEDAKQNAELNKIENAEFHAGKAEEILPKLYKDGLRAADVVIVDPPRKGCEQKTLETIASINPERIVYVSCNPATLARDMKFLRQKGFEPLAVQPVDMFPQTVHVECVVLMSKVKGYTGRQSIFGG